MGKFIDLIGQKFGRLTVVSRAERRKKKTHWNCICICGNQKPIARISLISGCTKSCGCLNKESASAIHTTHGLSKSLEFNSWVSMLTRCNRKKDATYKNYGGRGITYCERWKKFENFFEDMGKRPTPQHSLDRIDNNGNYCKENCRWATIKEQANNMRTNHAITYMGETMNISQWGEKLNFPPKLIGSRLYSGWSIEKALTTPKRKRKLKNPAHEKT